MTTSIENLPIEMLIHVLVHLRMKDLCEALFVTKLWANMIQSKHFWKERYLLIRGLQSTKINALTCKKFCLGYDRSWAYGIIDSEYRQPYRLFEPRCKKIVSGYDFSLAIDEDNSVWSVGSNIFGQLGLGREVSGNRTQDPAMIPGIKAREIATGARHALIIDSENDVWSCGENFCGQLAIGPRNNKYHPTKIPKFKALKVAGGIFHSLFLDMNQDLWVSGNNLSGELGIPGTDIRYHPSKVPLNFKVKEIAANGSFSMIVDTENNLWVTGTNRHGQLGLGDVESASEYKMVFKGVKRVSAGIQHSVIIDMEDNVWTTGDNSHGQLGLANMELDSVNTFKKVPRLKAQEIAAGGSHSLILDKEGNLWGCGSNIFGQLGVSIPFLYSFRRMYGITAQQISAGGCHTAFIGYVN